MRGRFLAAAAVVGSLAYAGSASALTVTTQGPDYSEQLHNTNVSTAQTEFDTVSKPTGYFVDWQTLTAIKLIQSGAGAGHAFIAGEGGAGLNDTLVTPDADPLDGAPDLLGFTQFGVTLEFFNKVTVPAPTDKKPDATKDVNLTSEQFQVKFTFSAAGPLTITIPGPLLGTDDFPSSGKFNFIAGPSDGYITSIEFLNVDYFTGKNQTGDKYANLGFLDFKQPSFDGVAPILTSVPEPATWAFMILGFGGAGVMLRRRKAALAA